MVKEDLKQPARASLVGAESIEDMAAAEGHSVASYTLALAKHVRPRNVPLSRQTERLRALARVGEVGASATAETLAQHLVIAEALYQRFSAEAAHWLASNDRRAPEVSERYASAAYKASAACLRIMSALAVMRQAAQNPTAPLPSPATALNAGAAD